MNPIPHLRTSWRYCRTRPTVAALVFLVAAGGVTCLCAAYLLVHAVLLRPVPGVPRAQELVVVSFSDRTGSPLTVPLASFDDVRPDDDAIAAWCPLSYGSLLRVERDGHTTSRPVTLWTPACGDVFQIAPALGRLWPAADERFVPAVLGHTYWEREFGRDPSVLGRQLVVDDVPVTVIGVTPREFTGLSIEIEPAVFLPMGYRAAIAPPPPGNPALRHLVGRRIADADTSHLRQIVAARLARLVADAGTSLTPRQRAGLADAAVTVDATGRGSSYLRDLYRQPLRFLALAAGLLVVTALLNVAGLSSAHAIARRTEFNVRRALGAGRGHRVRQLLAEGVLPIGAGAIAALPCAVVLARSIAAGIWTSPTPLTLAIRLDTGTVVAVAGAAVLMLAAFGLAPALTLVRRESGWSRQGHETRTSRRTSDALTIAQVTLSLTLAVVAVMLTRSVSALQDVDPGYRTSQLVFARLLRANSTAAPGDAAHYARLLDQIEREPGVRRAAYASAFPRFVQETIAAADAPSSTPLVATRDVVSDGFFDTIGISLREGRGFSANDTAASTPVAILSETLARALFPASSPLGRLVTMGDAKGPAVEMISVIGIVEDTRRNGARQPPSPVMYRPRSQQFMTNPILIVQAETSSAAIVPAIARTLQAIGRDYTGAFTTVEQDLARALAPERTLRLLALTFGSFVIALAGIGLFAVQTTSIWHQRRQTCIRLALGETPAAASLRLARRAFALVTAGVAIGLPAAAYLAYLGRGLIFGLSPFDPATLALVTSGFLGIGAGVALLPTRSTFRLNLLDVLRGE